MDVAANKQAVRAYFRALDHGDVAALDSLFTEDCRIHRPGLAQPLVGLAGIRQVVANAKANYSSLRTEIHALVGEGDHVACRLTHHAVLKGNWTSRLGTVDAAGKRLTWHPLVLFDFNDGRIAAEWVCRDELGMALDLGAVAPAG